jgi:hypothetical protein
VGLAEWSATNFEPTTPPTGPESRMFTGCSPACSTEPTPPLDCMSSGECERPWSRIVEPRLPVARLTCGPRKALIEVVTVRAYSFMRARMSLEAVT